MSEKTALRYNFGNFGGFSAENNFVTRLLAERFELKLSTDPELLIYSCYGPRKAELTRYDCLRLFFSGENRGWSFADTDFAVTSDLIEHPDHYRFPLYAFSLDDPFVQPEIDVDRAVREKTGFAALVVSNPSGTVRNRIHDLLDGYKPVASGGRFRNNVGGPVTDKMAFISDYKFAVACENSSYPGYTTEKLVQALQAETIPIYWGNPDVANEFNSKRFVNYHEFESEQAFLKRIIELDSDGDAYREALQQPWFVGGEAPQCVRREPFLNWLEENVADGRTPIAQRQSFGTAIQRVSDRWRMRKRYPPKIMRSPSITARALSRRLRSS